MFRVKRELAHLSDTRKSHNGHTRLDTKVLEGTRSLNLHFILNWNTKGTRTEWVGNANGTGRERELERFKNAFSAAFSVRFLLSGTVAQRFWRLWFIAFLLGFSLPPFPPGSVRFLLSFGVWVRVRVCAMSYLLIFPLSF